MKPDILTKFNNKTKMWITSKHPLYFETPELKITYSAGVFLQAGLNKTVNVLNNFELERLLKKGFVLSNKEIANVISLAKDGDRIIDEITTLLTKPLEKYLFLMDMASVSMRSAGLSVEEAQSIDIFAQLLQIDSVQVKLLLQFVTHSFRLEEKQCIQVFEEMKINNMPITMLELKYYMPELDYYTVLENYRIEEGKSVHLVDRCELRGIITVLKSSTLYITNANVKLYGKIIVDGGSLIVNDSVIVNKLDTMEELVLVKNYSTIIVQNSKINCKNKGGFINQQNGILEIKKSKIRYTTKNSAIKFWGTNINIEQTSFHHCFVPGNGSALLIENGEGEIKDCIFDECEAKNGGAIYTTDQLKITGCHFKCCKVVGYGAAVYYQGEVKSKITGCEYTQCYPEREEIIQYIGGNKEWEISDEYNIRYSTILDRVLSISSTGTLNIMKAVIYFNKGIVCKGKLNMKHAKMIANPEMENRDLIVMNQARECKIDKCKFDGRLSAGIINAAGTKLTVTNSVFINIAKGRAIYDPFEPTIVDCIFSYCQGGAIYTLAGKISRCTFVNCRAKSGAGVLMYGNRGEINDCNFVRCVSDYSGGAIDFTGGNQIMNCTYEECKPDNVSS